MPGGKAVRATSKVVIATRHDRKHRTIGIAVAAPEEGEGGIRLDGIVVAAAEKGVIGSVLDGILPPAA